jgi:hypothetical protein
MGNLVERATCRCFDRILLNGLIQPFQQPERVVGFFNTYREPYPVSKAVLRDIATQYQHWVTARAARWGARSSRPRQRNAIRSTDFINASLPTSTRFAQPSAARLPHDLRTQNSSAKSHNLQVSEVS